MKDSIVHVISALQFGGAETVLFRLVSKLKDSQFRHVVVNLSGGGAVEQQIRELGVPVISLGGRSGVPDPRIITRLARVLREERPVVVQTWMYHADLVGGLAARLAGSPPVVWNIRNGSLSPEFSKRMTIGVVRTCARLSTRLPKVIVCCAESARRIHVDLGYSADKMIVIQNGYDLELFQPDSNARAAIRVEAGIPTDASVIGVVARYHSQKDYRTFVRAAGELCRRHDDLHFLFCGSDVTWNNAELVGMIDDTGSRDRFHLLGYRVDIPAIQASLDIACLPSQGGEGFPNSVGEAMACGVPCVVTDVGESAFIVGDTGRVVPPSDPMALAQALSELLILSTEERTSLGQQARRRVAQNFDIRRFFKRYEDLYEQLANGSAVRITS